MLELYVAEVMSNDSRLDITDPGADGRVQIFVEPIMKGWTSLPWARPAGSAPGQSFIPETGDKLWVFCLHPRAWEDWYYTGVAEFKNKNPHNDLPAKFLYPNYRYFKHKGSFIAIGPTIHIENDDNTFIEIDGNDVNIEGGNVNVRADKVVIDSPDITIGQDQGKVLTTISDPVVDNITGAPHVGSSIIKGV